MEGTQVDRFLITKKLGEGGMGTVYAAQDVTTGAQVALKSLNKELMKSRELRDRFVREAQAMARLQHPNIVQFLGWVDSPQGWFIAMEFVHGEDFEKILEKMGVIPTPVAIDLFLPVLDALAYAHASGIIHRDLKPANLMRLDSGVVKVLDFGTAKLVDQSAMTRLGQQIGTSVYMPLEQMMGQPISFAADIYALGVTLYEMTTGKLPYYHDDPMKQVHMMMQYDPIPPSKVYPAAAALDAVILRALRRTPGERFPHALEFKQALLAAKSAPAGGTPVMAAAGERVASTEKKWWQFWK